ncbi:substrate-binding domain-containing protein [Inconstantimicrobium mannanitabidum]|nr:substrate-binding domain-containing protein [Clostridium sp. TW13]
MKRKVNWIIFIILLISLIISPMYYQNKTLVKSSNMRNISLILKNQSDDYWKSMKLGAEAAAKEFNVKLNIVAPENENDVAEQQNLINEAVESKSDALLLAPCSFNDLVKPVENAVDKGIPVFTLDSKVNTEKVSCSIVTDNLSAGKSAGEKLIGRLGENSVVAIIGSHKKAGSNELERYKGLKYVMERFCRAKIIDGLDGIKDLNVAELVTQELLLNDNKISAIVTLDYETSIGAAKAIEKLGLSGKIVVVAFDGDTQEIEYMENGTIQSVVVQSPFSMGYLGVKNAVLKLQGKGIPTYIESGFSIIDKENMYSPESQKVLFPFTQ